MNTGAFFFRRDLRLEDHRLLLQAARECSRLVMVYCWHPHQLWEEVSPGFARSGPWPTQRLLECLAALGQDLQAQGHHLCGHQGSPASFMGQYSQQLTHAYMATEPGTYEAEELKQLAQACQQHGVVFHQADVNGVWPSHELPFSLAELPRVFTDFRKGVEKARLPVAPPCGSVALPEALQLEGDPLPSWSEAPFGPPAPEPRAVVPARASAQAAHDRLHHYLHGSEAVASYKNTRNGLLGVDYSSKFSPYLAWGQLSPHRMVHELRQFEDRVVSNSSTYWLWFELLWREFFRHTAYRYGPLLYQPGGIQQKEGAPGQAEPVAFWQWAEGRTGQPFVDANMSELRLSGFMSNRGRQNVASYLVHDMGVDWRWGARWFEHCLVDYDPASNWGNWAYIAGVGNDPRPFRKFNVAGQAERYDPKGTYVQQWLGAD